MPPRRWRPELAVEIATHQQLGLHLQHLAPQVAGLLCDLKHYLCAEPRMADYAGRILDEAAAAAPYNLHWAPGYQETRRLVAGQWIVSDSGPLEALEERWHALPVPAVTAAIWVVRAYHRIHARRHGAVTSPHAAHFLSHHDRAVHAMARTLRGSQPPVRRYVQPWRRRP